MGVAGNSGGSGGAKNLNRAQRKPKHRIVKVREHTRRIPVAPSPAVKEQHAERAQRIARPRKPRPPRQAPPPARAPSPAVKEQHAAKALEAPRGRRAERARKSAHAAERDVRLHAAGSMGRLLQERLYHETIAQTRPDRKANRHANLAASLEAMRARTKTASDRAVAKDHAREKAAKSKDVIFSRDPKLLKEAGFHKAGALDKLAELPGRVLPTVGASAYQTTKAAIEDPKDVLPKTAKGVGEAIVGIPAGLAMLAIHPGKAGKALVQDYERRYGDVIKDPKKFRERLKKEGAAPELADLAAFATAGGATAGRGLQAAARAGHLGERAAKVATERPALRVSGAVAKKQPVHENFIRNAAGAARDSARAKVQHRRAGHDHAPLEVRQAEANGEVTHIRQRATKRAQHKAVAEAKGRRLARMKAEGQREEKAARKNIHSLNKTERRALNVAMKFGIHDAETARRVLPQWIARVKAARADLEKSGKKIPKSQDNVAELEFLLKHADEAFTPKLAHVAEQEGERAARVGEGDPGFDNAAGERRRHIAQAELTGEARPLTTQDLRDHVAQAKLEVKDAEKELARQERMRQDSLGGFGVARGRAQILSRNVEGMRGEHMAAKRTVRADENQFAGGGHGVHLAAEGMRAATRNVERAQAHLKSAKEALAHAEHMQKEGGYHVRGHGPVSVSDFHEHHLERVIERAREQGLKKPGYTPSEKRPAGTFAAFAIGGQKAVAASKRYEGALLRTGRENMDPEAHVLSLQKGIKRKHNWNLVADQFEHHAVDGLKHKTLQELRDELDRRGINPDTVAFWNPGRFRAERRHFDNVTDGGGNADIADPTFESRNIQDALGHASAKDIDSARDFHGTNNNMWSVVPRAVYDEIHADIKPSSGAMRAYDIVKGKTSRILLAHPAWLQFQVASNGLMAGLAGVGPVDMVKAQRWWKTLSQEERDAIEPEIGVHQWYDDQRKLGAQSNNRVVNAYRAFKTTPFYRKAHKGNPLNLLFRADNAQNNFFRKAVLYNGAKREAYRNMGHQAGRIMEAQHRIVNGILGKEPDQAMRALLKDGPTLERHAQAVNDFLGNWTTYTAKERRYFARSVMFYGFMRFSTKLAFYTMPLEHPLISSILLQLGHLNTEELKKLFGGDVPAFEIGSFYDHGHKLNLSRLNPFFNAIQFQGPGSLVGSFGPAAQVIADQVAGKNVSFDKPFTVHGDTRYVESGKKLSLADRMNIIASELEKVSPYVRMVERWQLKNRQTSDSWLLHPRDTGSPGLGEKSHKLGDVAKEGFLPLLGESAKPSLDAARQLHGSSGPLKFPPIPRGKAKFPPASSFPSFPKVK